MLDDDDVLLFCFDERFGWKAFRGDSFFLRVRVFCSVISFLGGVSCVFMKNEERVTL